MRAAANGFRAATLPAMFIVAASACGDVRSAPTQSASPEQPIAFMHTVHAGDNRIPCAYCHFSSNASEEAGIPAVGTCMGCHRFVQGTSPDFQQEIQKLMEFWSDSTSIPWQRVHSVPEFVQFTHEPHIRAGVTCAACHGDVASMVQVERVAPLTMGWCVNCHRDNGAPDDCAACHY